MNNRDNDKEIEIDLRQIFAVIMSKLPIIIVVAILGGMIAFAYTKFLVKPVYQSTTQIHIMNNDESNKVTTISDLQAGSYLTKDYKVIVTSAPVMEKVIADLNLAVSVKALRGMISVDVITDTRILTISVNNTDPWMAKKIADDVREVSKEYITEIMDIKSINTVEEGDLPISPISPSILKNTILGILIGLVLVVAIVIINFLVDDTIKTPEDIEKYLELSVLASIPKIEDNHSSRRKKSKKNTKKKMAAEE